ncbi:MAG TPA: hypothetical protein VIY48_02850 [Candidatus Paceibacterota bacterium]
MTSINPDSWIQASAKALAETLSSKNSDYAPGGEFSNFEKAAEVVGTDPLYVITTQVAIKMTRIESILKVDDQPNNESLVDSFLDLAGYAIIAHAYMSASDHTLEPEPDDPFTWHPGWNTKSRDVG